MKYECNVTQPWHRDELCYVNGYGLVYRVNLDNEMEVMIPGRCRGYTPRYLRTMGYDVKLPEYRRELMGEEI